MSRSALLLKPLLFKPSFGFCRSGSHLNVITNKNCSFKSIEIRTCGKLYRDLKKKHFIYRKSPSDGIQVDVNYADTLYNGNIDGIKTIVALHGSPGSFNDYGHLINRVGSQGIRIIAPNFPRICLTDKTEAFYHSTDEKFEYLNDFLNSINVKNIDCLLMHSSGSYAGMKLWSHREELGYNIKSVALINPAGHRTIKAMKPHWFIDNFVRVNFSRTGRNLLKAIGRPILAMKGVAVKIDKMDEVSLAAITMYLAKVERLAGHFMQLRESKIPSLYVFGENDKLVDTQISWEMANILNAKEDIIWRYGEEGILEKPGIQDDWLKVMAFKKGGHHSFLKNEKLLNDAIFDLLERSDGEKLFDYDRESLRVRQ